MTAWTIYICFIGAFLLVFVNEENKRLIRSIALLAAAASFVFALSAIFRYGGNPGTLTEIVRVPWVPSLGMEYHLAVDGITLVLLLLTGIAAIAGILFSWNVEHRTREFFCFYL